MAEKQYGVGAVGEREVIGVFRAIGMRAVPAETDTEVAAHLLSFYYTGDPIEAISKTVNVMKGSFALGILCSDFPDTLFAAA